MKIETLHLRNYRAFPSLTLPFAPVTLITGPNGSGKTTIRAALELWAAGKNELTDDRGTGLELQVHTGAPRAEITITAPGGSDEITRSFPPHRISMPGVGELGVTQGQGELERRLGFNADTARPALRGERFSIDSTAKEQTDYLFRLLNAYYTGADVAQALEEKANATGLPLKDVFARALSWPPTANLARPRKHFEDARRDCKREIARLKAAIADMKTQGAEALICQSPTEEDITGAESVVAQLQSEIDEAARTSSALTTARLDLDEVERKIQILEHALSIPVPATSGLGMSLASCRSDLASLDAQIETVEKRIETLSTSAGRLREKESARVSLRLDITAAQKEVDHATHALASLSHSTCPTCHQELHTEEARREFAESYTRAARELAVAQEALALLQPPADSPIPTSLAGQIASLNGRITADRALLRDLRAQRATVVSEESRARAQVDRVRESRARDEQALSNLRDSATSIRAQVAALERKDLSLSTQAQADLDQALASARAFHRELIEQRAQAETHKEERARFNRLNEDLTAQETLLKSLEELVYFFGPKGFELELLNRKLAPIQNEVNGILERWGFEVEYEQPSASIIVRTPRTAALCPGNPDAQFLPFAHLSDGERILVSLAHQAFFAVATRIRIVVVDRIESLDEDAQQALFEAAADLQAGDSPLLDHIILLGVAPRVSPPESPIFTWHELDRARVEVPVEVLADAK